MKRDQYRRFKKVLCDWGDDTHHQAGIGVNHASSAAALAKDQGSAGDAVHRVQAIETAISNALPALFAAYNSEMERHWRGPIGPADLLREAARSQFQRASSFRSDPSGAFGTDQSHFVRNLEEARNRVLDRVETHIRDPRLQPVFQRRPLIGQLISGGLIALAVAVGALIFKPS